jgi:hypothetical protein
MKAQVQVETIALSEMKIGQIARGLDDKSIFVCGYYRDNENKENRICILDMLKMDDQYTDNRNESQRVILLKPTDKVLLTV